MYVFSQKLNHIIYTVYIKDRRIYGDYIADCVSVYIVDCVSVYIADCVGVYIADCVSVYNFLDFITLV